MTCSLNASYLQPYTPSVTYTPNFKKFSEDALTFKEHYTESGHSGTAFSSILTGSHADIHQVYYHPNPIASGVEILPQVLESRGYSPNYWISHSMANAAVRPKLEAALAANTRNILSSNNRRLELLLDQLQKNNEEKAVITIAFTVTHAPYKIDNLKKFIATYPNESGLLTGFTLSRIEHLQQIYLEHRFVFSYGSQGQIDALDIDKKTLADLDAFLDVLYKSRVNYLDRLFGELVDQIDQHGLKDDTLFVFTSDHGEVTSRPNALFRWTHGSQLAPEVLRVPLMIRAPKSSGLKSGVYTGITRSIDLFPTVLDLVGHESFGYDQLQGVNLGPHIRAGGKVAELSAQFHTTLLATPWVKKSKDWDRFYRYFPNQSFEDTMWVGLRRDNWVFKWRPDGAGGMVYEAFDHSKDPDETTNRYSIEDPRHQRAGEELREYRKILADTWAKMKGDNFRGLDLEDETEALRSLGYLE